MPIEVALSANVLVESGKVLTSEHFGIVQTGFGDFREYSEEFVHMSGGHIRWPGGTLSEVQTNVYGLDIPGLFNGTQLWLYNADRVRPDLKEMMDFAVANDVGLSVQIPTVRYAGDFALAEMHLTQLLDDLSSGHYGAIPKSLKFEIGNEYYGLAEYANNPSAYGELANHFLAVIDNFTTNTGQSELADSLQIGVQMGRSEAEDKLIRAEIEPGLLPAIDFLIAHQLPYRFEAVDMKDYTLSQDGNQVNVFRAELIDAQVAAWNDLRKKHSPLADKLSYELTGWTVGEASTKKAVDLRYQDYGARQASAALEVFSTHVGNGADGANLWGVGVGNPNKFADFEDGVATYSFGGEVFKLMAENLVGSRIVDGFQNNDRADSFTMYTFRDIDTLDVFISANDIPDGGFAIDLVIEGFGNEFTASVDRIGYSYAADGPQDKSDPSSRLFEVPVITSWINTSSNGQMSVSLTQDFELIHMTLESNKPDEAVRDFYEFSDAIEFLGDNSANRVSSIRDQNALLGMDGNDTLVGGVGSDYISGGAGDDVLIGDLSSKYFGNDVLEAGQGDDWLSGGGGADVFVFKPGMGDNIIADLSVDSEASNGYVIVGNDFDPMLDTISLIEFGYKDASEALSHVGDDLHGTATFSDQSTTIELVGVTAAELFETDFFVL